MRAQTGAFAGGAFFMLALAACGGGGSAPAPVVSAPPRGTLLQNPPHQSAMLSAADLLAALGAPVNQQILALSGVPVCDIGVYHLQYATVGARAEATEASGALMVPSGLDARCHGDRPILLYAHGTSTSRSYNIGDLQDAQNAEGLLLAALFVAQGYIVVAPNYAGYDTSTLAYHPYLNADQQSKDMIDALSAARQALGASGLLQATAGTQLFITGYSQGGYVAMATQRAMQAAGMPVTAAAPMSGPYALSAFFDAVMSGQVDGGAPVFMTLLLTGYQKAYGNIYAAPAELFEDPYAAGIDALLPTTGSRGDLYASGKLPQFALFSATPPEPRYAAITPATQPAQFASVYALGFGSGNLIRNSYRLSYLQDIETHPSDAQLPLRQALARNDLRDFVPTVPTLLCGGDGDPIVYWFNTQLVQDYWTAQLPGSPLISVLNLEAPAAVADPYANLKHDFALARQAVALVAVAQGANDGGAAAVFEVYHAGLVAPFCLAAVRDFFASRQ